MGMRDLISRGEIEKAKFWAAQSPGLCGLGSELHTPESRYNSNLKLVGVFK